MSGDKNRSKIENIVDLARFYTENKHNLSIIGQSMPFYLNEYQNSSDFQAMNAFSDEFGALLSDFSSTKIPEIHEFSKNQDTGIGKSLVNIFKSYEGIGKDIVAGVETQKQFLNPSESLAVLIDRLVNFDLDKMVGEYTSYRSGNSQSQLSGILASVFDNVSDSIAATSQVLINNLDNLVTLYYQNEKADQNRKKLISVSNMISKNIESLNEMDSRVLNAAYLQGEHKPLLEQIGNVNSSKGFLKYPEIERTLAEGFKETLYFHISSGLDLRLQNKESRRSGVQKSAIAKELFDYLGGNYNNLIHQIVTSESHGIRHDFLEKILFLPMIILKQFWVMEFLLV